MAQIKKLEVDCELREGVSSKTNQPYRFYVYTVTVNGIKIQLKPESGLAGRMLETVVDGQ